ncbi:TetR/AcrR family transcriptional regulator [Novosphingobium sp. G106]|uniref:TetR/AcrR family transcriptional regulator n=1 Tax=Novosphingobium sp. G106 TaxID=2849500 RepID=UPI001C2CCD32|nr:TetR/AcrR family transcriptional regulator [Novosphingobium sp. G106]MBV1689514.1 TetR/AcrR family transcriptional regulator [Novosphingobium sp. G106]
MPRIIDHDERKLALARIAAKIIAEEGWRAATIQRIGRSMDCSTKVVTHYFPDKKALMLMAFKLLAEDTQTRFEATCSIPGRTTLECIASLLPIDERSERLWRVSLAYWEFVSEHGRDFSEEIYEIETAQNLVEELFRNDGIEGDLPRLARLAINSVHGIGIQAIMNPTFWTKEQQIADLNAQITALLRVESRDDHTIFPSSDLSRA